GYALKHTKGKVGSKRRARGRRHLRVRRQVVGTPQRPRLVVTRSQRHVFVQVVDDSVGNTLASASTMEADLRAAESTKSEKARTRCPSMPARSPPARSAQVPARARPRCPVPPRP